MTYGKTVLIVDDCEDNIFILKMLLKTVDKEMKVLCASCGEEAIEIFKENYCTNIIMDYDMPGINGEETLQRMDEFLVTKVGKHMDDVDKNYCIFTAGCNKNSRLNGHEIKTYHKPAGKKMLREMLDS
jgi:response regulator RpfG family c-di-GMP phosphodiesterase